MGVIRGGVRMSALAAITVAASCGPAGDPLGTAAEESLALPVAEAPATDARLPASLLSALSQALDVRSVQQELILAMRESPYLHHRLELLGLLDGTEAGEFQRRTAAEMGVTPDQLARLVRSLPAIDIFVLTREDRLGWTGGGTVALAWMPNLREWQASRVFVAGQEWQPSLLTTLSGVNNVVFALEPAREKLRRVRPQADRPGTVIQEADDGEYVVQVTFTSADGVSVSESSACEEGSETCGGGGGGGSIWTRIDSFCWLFGDDPLGVGDVEIEFRARPMGGGLGVWDVLYGGLTAATPSAPRCLFPNQQYVQWRPSSPGDFLVVEMWEKDPWPNPDDSKGQANWAYGEAGQLRDFYEAINKPAGWAVHSW